MPPPCPSQEQFRPNFEKFKSSLLQFPGVFIRRPASAKVMARQVSQICTDLKQPVQMDGKSLFDRLAGGLQVFMFEAVNVHHKRMRMRMTACYCKIHCEISLLTANYAG
jgi:hypothetical protein